ncbi:p53 and DNA damage-regulated protein 1 [Halocaridina rubra]|uniref:P53 and DNA damage-regulated protein 1 n=1 Tax=Halocaridina rubra TaxID=373956 RepID=A0AAN8XK67_HALRR
MAESPERIQQYLVEVEEAAEDILSDQQEIVSLDRRRNTNRQALRQLRSTSPSKQAVAGTRVSNQKDWICIGNMFLRLPKEFVVDSIEKEEKQLDTEIRNLRNGLRNKVNLLNDLEDKQETLGTNIKPLTRDEWKAVRQALGKLD